LVTAMESTAVTAGLAGAPAVAWEELGGGGVGPEAPGKDPASMNAATFSA
jgi:hypothetical protein